MIQDNTDILSIKRNQTRISNIGFIKYVDKFRKKKKKIKTFKKLISIFFSKLFPKSSEHHFLIAFEFFFFIYE